MKKTLHFSVRIAAPRERVWNLMLAPDSYREWTAPFCEGSWYEGSWDEGQRIRFLTPQGEGMVAQVAQHRPGEYVSLRHLGMIARDGSVDLDSDAVKAWAPAYENYRFVDRDGATEVQVEMDTLPGYEQFMQDTWPQALERLKALCERAT
ncbi:MAG TPA: SRPBCC domain-containing protein [Ramlibacter sp.]|nr:SRPBCC domain-containing protein [Ramlibacter sp.]